MEQWEKEALEVKKAKPSHVLFLCVANSARSQLAEGIARSLAPKNVKISSAGSSPSIVNPLAVEVLKEVGIDIKDQYSKNINSIDTKSVDAVITLCAEEVCPLFLGKAIKLHWGLPDPALAGIEAFRNVRDELKKRLTVLFNEEKK